MPTTLDPISEATRAHEKLDPRLAALVELDDAVFAPADPEPPPPPGSPPPDARKNLESARSRQRRSGPLAFLRGPRPRLLPPDAEGNLEAARFSTVPVFVTAKSAAALDSIALETGIVEWRCSAGAVATGHVTLAQLHDLEAHEQVIAVEWTGGAKPQGSGDGLPAGGVSPRSAVGLPPDVAGGLDGTGVVIGVVDVEGIDLYHPDFFTADGYTRLHAIWDQDTARRTSSLGAPPSPYHHGVAYDRLALRKEVNPNNRERGSLVGHTALKVSHGTLVAGVAAGSGLVDPTARGIAPKAQIVFVNTRASGAGALAAMTEIAEAVDFVFRTAGDRPCVVNLSLGDDLGPHDGNSPAERFFDALLAERPGRAVVVAAGNHHARSHHVSGALHGAAETATLLLHTRATGEPHAVIEIWYDRVAPDEQGITVQIASADGQLQTPVITPDGLPRAFDLGATRLLVASVRSYPGSDDALVRLEIFPRDPEGDLAPGPLRIHLSGDAVLRPFHAWLDHSVFELHAAPTRSPAPPPVTVTSPGTCKSAITVSACDDDDDTPTFFAGVGPARHGVDKPDVVACGVRLRGPSASTVPRHYSEFTGTSAAAPLVTGSIALFFQHALGRGVHLTPDQTRALVRAAAARHAGAKSGPARFFWPQTGTLDDLFAAAAIPLPPPGESPGPHKAQTPASDTGGASLKKERQHMITQDQQTRTKEKDLARGKDDQQIGVGFYQLRQGEDVVGASWCWRTGPTRSNTGSSSRGSSSPPG